jgi:phosphopantetheinyl transferase
MFPAFPLSLILIADTKKPFLADEAFHFSISHCGDYAAVMVSSTNRVGVDIEIIQPKVDLLKNKFLTDLELDLVQALGKKYLTAAWSIKETLFKWYGLGQVDFKKDLHIQDIEVNANGFIAKCLFKKQLQHPLEVYGFFLEGKTVCWLMSEPTILI